MTIVEDTKAFQPLAARMRPQHIDEFFGQEHLLAKGKPLRNVVEKGWLHSMILWGPPGTGKTTLARLIAKGANAAVESISAVLAGVKDIRSVVERAKERRAATGQMTILFVDEVHRFNKAQQDAFLPYVEDGTLVMIGATTENPSFELNNALLSRTRVYVLKRLTEAAVVAIIDLALQDKERGLGDKHIYLSDAAKGKIAHAADGDARQALNFLEICSDFATGDETQQTIDDATVDEVLSDGVRRFDKRGEMFYDQISALHKSVRGSDPDAALYWFARMLDGGCDPEYLARRVIRMATEDIGNADPRALTLALEAAQTYERLGTPEGELAIAQAVIYMACASKSNAGYVAFGAAKAAAKEYGSLDVPLHLRNAPTRLMKQLDYGKGYRYAHDEKDAFAAGEKYFPDDMPVQQYYFPVERGFEIKIAEKLRFLKQLNEKKS